MLLAFENYTLLDKSIAIIIVLFILSLISERFITWFKLYFFKKGNTLFGLFNWEEDYSVKSDDPELEKERERRILSLNLVLSIIISLLAHADLFKILQEESPFNALGWKYQEWENISHPFLTIIKTIAGCILGGFFISLGSKFWHDTLDMLFYAKNLKQKLSDPNTYDVENVKQLDDFLAVTNLEIVSSAFDKVKDELKQKKGVIGVGIGKNKNSGKYMIDVMVDDTAILSSIDSFVSYKLSSGKEIKIPIEKTIATIPVIHIGPADSIANSAAKSIQGSVGCIVEDNEKRNYILTCFHNVNDPDNKDYIFNSIKKNDVSSPADSTTPIGKITDAIRNNFIDAAIIGPISPEKLSNHVKRYGDIIGFKNVYEGGEKENVGSKVFISGLAEPGNKSGYVTHLYFNSIFNYGTSESPMLHELQDLIAISDNNKAVTDHGDSGAPVLDYDGNILGIIVGGNELMSFAMPITFIFSKLNVKLKIYPENQAI